MRVTPSLNQSQFLAAIESLQSNLSQTQNQITSGLAFTTASQNPTAAGAVNNYNQALAQSQQYVTNSSSAQTRLSTEDSTLSQVQTQLQSLRDLALEANSSTLSSADRSSIATQAKQIQATLVTLANTQDGKGEYLFSGFASQTQPFTWTASGAAYNGDQGNRVVQIAAGQTIADGDNGNAVFNQVKTGNGTFAAAAGAANTGTGVLGATTVSTAAGIYDGGTYSINFTAPGTYQVRDSSNVLVTSGSYTDGGSISFRGVQVTITGAPATGDSFSVAPSTNQSVFTTVQNIVNALQVGGGGTSVDTAKLNNALAAGINNIDQALGSLSNVRASVGARLNTITTQQSVAGTQQVQLQSSISTLQSLDYASAITTLNQQNTTLSAALQAYSLTQNLSLFKYI